MIHALNYLKEKARLADIAAQEFDSQDDEKSSGELWDLYQGFREIIAIVEAHQALEEKISTLRR